MRGSGADRPRTPARDAAVTMGVTLAVVLAVVFLRGYPLGIWARVNPDEAELLAQARAALREPVPYATWTMGTTGPTWPFALALLGLLGAPLTVAFAHLLAAVLVGLLVATFFVLARRALGTPRAAIAAAVGGIPFALVYPLGGMADFAGLSTELLPTLLVLLSALLLRGAGTSPWRYAVVGALATLAVGAKFQILPVAGAVLIVALLLERTRPARLVGLAGAWAAGAIVPAAALVLAVAVSPGTDPVLLAQQLHFLGGYGGGVPLGERLGTTTLLLLRQPLLYVALAAVVRLAMISEPRVRVARAVLAASGILAVYAGGMAFGHYLIVLYGALALAVALPILPGALLVPRRRLRYVLVGAAVAGLVAVAGAGLAVGRLVPTTPAALAATLSPASVVTVPELARRCPPGSGAVAWGWSPELYVHYDWRNAIPMLTSLGTATDALTRDRVAGYLAAALDDVECIVDATDAPFFVGPEYRLADLYPDLAARLDAVFTTIDVLDCATCTVYVRD